MSGQRGLVRRIERKLEVSVGDAFARMFGGSIVPQEVEAMLRREASEGIRPVAGNRLLAPNEYIITLGTNDYQKVGADPDLTSDAFAKQLAGYIGEQGWQTYGDVVVRFEKSANLHTGQFRTRGAVNPDVEPRPRADELAPPQSDHAFNAEPGVPAMTENSRLRRWPGAARPGDDYYDPYAPPRDDHAAPDPRAPDPHAAPAPRGGYPSKAATADLSRAAATPSTAHPTRAAATPSSAAIPTKAATAHPSRAAVTPTRVATAKAAATAHPTHAAATPSSAATPTKAATAHPSPAAATPSTAHPTPAAATPTTVATAKAAVYGAPEPRGGYPEQRGYPDQGGYGAPEQRGGYPEQGGGYDPGYGGGPGYGRQDYGQPADYGRQDYGQQYAAPSAAGYAEPGREYDYGQPAEAGGYGQGRLRPGRVFVLGYRGHVAAR